jgi:hypothetical protein
MKKVYSITPSIHGVLSDDELYFEGIKKPSAFYSMRDQETQSEENIEILEKYFNDLYNLFLKKLSAFAMDEVTSDEQTLKLQALLQEMIKVKKLIEAASKAQI